MKVAGIDLSSRAVDVVLLDEDSDAATWHRFELSGGDAFERARAVRAAMPSSSFWDEVVAVGIEDPRGYGAGSLYRVQGAILASLPRPVLVQPWIPSAWRKAVGLKGNASKDAVYSFANARRMDGPLGWVVYPSANVWPQDAMDAFCIALATRSLLEYEAAA